MNESELGGRGLHVLDLCFGIGTSVDGGRDEGIHVVIVS
jgi:hypothetical protein